MSKPLVKKDEILARKVIGDDDIADELFVRDKEEFVSLIPGKQDRAVEIWDLLMAAKYFRAGGRHAKYITMWVEFIMTSGRQRMGLNCYYSNRPVKT